MTSARTRFGRGPGRGSGGRPPGRHGLELTGGEARS
jgi:hypothetical protein